MYPPEMTQPMREELTSAGIKELRTPEEVDAAFAQQGTLLLFVNSVCGCAAGNARPALRIAVKHSKRPSQVTTVFAGVDVEATQKARSFITQYPPSSPSIALFKDGKLVLMLQRRDIEGKPAEIIAAQLTEAFDTFC